MWDRPSAPTIGHSAFADAQVEALRQCIAETTPYMRTSGVFANSVSHRGLCTQGRADLAERSFRVFAESRAHAFALEVFPEGYCFLLEYCSFRRHDPSTADSHLQLHFDANFVGVGAPVYNVWVTLDDVGDGAPGLSFLNPAYQDPGLGKTWQRTKHHALGLGRGEHAPINLMFDARKIAAFYGTTIESVLDTPRAKAGAFIAFHQCVAHATEVVAGPSKPRRSIEFRISSVSAVPEQCRLSNSQVVVPRTAADGSRTVDFLEVDRLA